MSAAASSLPVLALPLLRQALPSSCQLQHIRGEQIWLPEEDLSQFQNLSLQPSPDQPSSSAPPASAPSASRATGSTSSSATPTKGNIGEDNLASTTPLSSSPSVTSSCPPSKPSTPQKSGGKKKKASASPMVATSPEQLALQSKLHSLCSTLQSSNIGGLEFHADLNSKDRVLAHHVAEELKLEHESLGNRPRRHLYVSTPYQTEEHTLYIVCRMGHIYLEGQPIDAIGLFPTPLVDTGSRNCRIARDGVHFHVTLLHSSLVEKMREDPPAVLKKYILAAQKTHAHDPSTVSTLPPDDAPSSSASASSSSAAATAEPVSAPPTAATPSGPLIPLRVLESALVSYFASSIKTGPQEFGIGKAEADGHVAFFRVLEWKQANALRVALGFEEADFHITIGFKSQDVHNVSKNKFMLVH